MDDLTFPHVEFHFDGDGDLEIEFVGKTEHERNYGYMGRYLGPERTEQLRQWLNSRANAHSAGDQR